MVLHQCGHFCQGRGAVKGRTQEAGILLTAQDWQLSVDLEKQLRFPQHIVSTSLRPDILLVLEIIKNIILMELTVRWEDQMRDAHDRKRTQYKHLAINCWAQGLKASCMPNEVDCRGTASIKPLVHWASEEQQGAEPSRILTKKPRKHRNGSGSGEDNHGNK